MTVKVMGDDGEDVMKSGCLWRECGGGHELCI